MSAAVLLVVFNRPGTTRQVFDAIRAERPSRLYVAADGPRRERPGDHALCEEVRRIATAIDWPCELKTLFREENLGCRRAVSGAIDWFFGQEAEGIILEDDTVPHPDFFRYCNDLLNYHRDDDKVMAICGGSYFRNPDDPSKSYTFCHTFDPWGWATWASAWRRHQNSVEGFDETVLVELSSSMGLPQLDLRAYWNRCFGMARDKSVDSWCYYWICSIFRNRGLVAFPMMNLVSNVGFGPWGTHTTIDYGDVLPWVANLPTRPMTPEIVHPAELVADVEMERRLYRYRFLVEPNTSTSRALRSFVHLIKRVTPTALIPYLAQIVGRKALARMKP